MPAIVSDRIRINNARKFLASLSGGSPDKYYVTLGKTTPWTNEPTAPTPGDTVEERDYQYWADMFGAKRMFPEDVALCIPRYNWTTGTIYDQYRSDDPQLFQKRFFVATFISGDGSYNLYMCLNNYNNAVSTVLPTGTSTSRFQTADNYIWKFMYKVTAAQAAKFLTNDYIFATDTPGTEQAAVVAAAVSGAIESIRVLTPGTGYTSAPTVAITGDGTGATANAVVVGAQLVQIIVTAAGSGYTQATVSLSGGGASVQGTAKAMIPPYGGHGSNIVDQLGAYSTMFSMSFQASETQTLTVVNDYRNIGVLQNPLNFGTAVQATATNIRQTFKYNITAPSGTFSPDEIVTGGTSGAKARVVEYDVTNLDLYVNNQTGTFTNNETITGGTSAATATIGTGLSDQNPGFQLRSGQFFFLENRQPIIRNINQTETIKDIIEF